ncbi:hypothetical protein E1264_23555 [Actinomadura sp. KC216]|uniref:hypothetical protein n=1 Tax=Actinomadura sp. KC216 TaxID=2530370 RepID=UPI0010451A24|nr:hypothetical protein [Actinomadura sp. KC216]TDB84735.1 hypothetical protein E1264_23555 [Actinomadura sp. KC216]
MKRLNVALPAVPALLAAGLATAAPAAASIDPGTSIQCTLHTIEDKHASVADCRRSHDYEHWIKCQNKHKKIIVEITRSFTDTHSKLSCPRGYRLLNHSIGV